MNDELSNAIVPPQENPDRRITIMENGELIGHAALWWKNAPTFPGERLGIIGGFFAKDEPTTQRLLADAEQILRAESCTLAVGPMNGNTWRKHRFVEWSDGSPSFLLEPDTPMEHLTWWKNSGYETLMGYSSSRLSLDGTMTTPEAIAARLQRNGVSIRGVNIDNLEQELSAIYEVCLVSFQENFLYTPMVREEFIARYAAMKAWFSPDYVCVAECDGTVCGFVFSLPDPLAIREPALIVKTLASLPQRHFAGLGSLLVDHVQANAHRHGIRSAIHALQRDENSATRITERHHGTVMRRYVMLQKSL